MSTFEAVFVMFRETNVAKSNLLNTNGFADLFLGGKNVKTSQVNWQFVTLLRSTGMNFIF